MYEDPLQQRLIFRTAEPAIPPGPQQGAWSEGEIPESERGLGSIERWKSKVRTAYFLCRRTILDD